MEFFIRKAAHCFEYMVLGMLLYLNIRHFLEAGSGSERKKTVPFMLSLAAGIVYAVSDEIHQFFIPGRSCEFRDVCIDSLGVLIGTVLIKLLYTINKKDRCI